MAPSFELGSSVSFILRRAAKSLRPMSPKLPRCAGVLPILTFLLFSGALAPGVRAQCNTPPTVVATIWFPDYGNASQNAWPSYVGGQAIPWYVHFVWNAPCLGTITITSDYGQPQGPETLLTLPLSSSTGTYDNGSPQSGGPPGPGFNSPPPVPQDTPWSITFTGTAGTGVSNSVGNATLLPLTARFQFQDNKIVAATNATTQGSLIFNAAPDPNVFNYLAVESSTSLLSLSYSWPPPYVTNGTGVAANVTQSVDAALPATISAALYSNNGVEVDASTNISIQPPSDPGQCDDPCNEGGSPINFATGNVFIQEKDYSLPGLGGGLQLTRTWNSLWQNIAPPTTAGMFGVGWRSNLEEQLYLADESSQSTITYYRGDGSSWVFDPSGQLLSPGNAVVQNCGPGTQLCFDSTKMQYWILMADGTKKMFSQLGLLLAIVDRNGNQTTFGYDDRERLNSVTDPAGHSITINYNDPNNIYQATSVQDSVGVIAAYTYDASSRLTRVTYADGSSLNFNYGANSMITSVTDGQGKLLESHTYDAADRGLTSSRADGADALTVDYSTPGQTTVTNSLGYSTVYTLGYWGGRMLVTSIDGPGCASCGGRGSQTFSFDPRAVVLSATDAVGNQTCYQYDGELNISEKTLTPPGGTCPGSGGGFGFAALAGAAAPATTASTTSGGGSAAAPAADVVIGTSPADCANGATSSIQFCSAPVSAPSLPTSTTGATRLLAAPQAAPAQSSPSEVTWDYTYNNFNEVTSATDPAGNTTVNTYDANGNLLTSTTPSPDGTSPGFTTSFAYDSEGELTETTDPNGNITTMTYTPAGLLASTTDAQGNTTSYTYDARGNRLSLTDALHQTTYYTYDEMNRLTLVTGPDGSTTSYGYDYRGRRTSVTDPDGNTTSYQYDDADRLTTVIDPAGHVTSYGYDTENERTSITDAAGRTTRFAYDPLGHVTQVTFPSSLTESYTYDAVENMLSKTDRNGNTINYAYDFLNRMTSKTYPNSTGVSYEYDILNHLIQATDPSGTYTFDYDNLGRLIDSSTQYSFLPGTTLTNTYTYDANSNRLSFTNPQGGVSNYTYDSLNRMTGITDFAQRQFTFSYDALGRRTGLTRPNGVDTTYSYDPLSHLLSVLHQLGGSTIDGTTYTYDAAGNRTSKTALPSNVTSSYTYDPAYQLTQVMQGATRTEAYTYDAVGNRTYQPGAPYTYNDSNEMLTREGATFTYDNDGDQLTWTNGSGTRTYTWDFENRLTSLTLPNGNTVTYEYDPFGRRIEKSGPAATTIYVYDGSNIEAELNGNGQLGERFVYGPGTDEPLVGQRQPKIFYYEADGQGSVTSLTDPTGAVAAAYTYNAFGFQTAQTGSATNWFRYTGREFDSSGGLYYYRARYYEPMTGRFLSEDPIRFSGGINFYAYVGDDPTNFTDPEGFCKSKKQQCIDNFLKNNYGNFVGGKVVPDFSLISVVSNFWGYAKSSALTLSVKAAAVFTPKALSWAATTTGKNLAAYPGMAAESADALESGAFWGTTAATAEWVVAPAAVGATAFSTTADAYARWSCRNVQ